MPQVPSEPRRWPPGYRLLLWAVGVTLVILILFAVSTVMNAPR
jgi:hypothetical protein